MILAAITSRPVALAGCAVLSVFLIGARMEVGQVRADLKAQVAESRKLATDLGTCRANVASLDGALTLQNEAVASLKASGDQMARNAEKAAVEARKAQRTADQYAAKLAGFQAGKTCEEREGNVVRLIEGMG